MKCESEKKWCAYCQMFTWFYRYPQGASRQWVCDRCSNSLRSGGGAR